MNPFRRKPKQPPKVPFDQLLEEWFASQRRLIELLSEIRKLRNEMHR